MMRAATLRKVSAAVVHGVSGRRGRNSSGGGAAHWHTQENRPSGSAPQASPDGHVPPHVGWELLMHGVEAAGTQPHVALSVLSSIRSVEQTAPFGQAPPHVAPANTEPPVSLQGVATDGRQAHDCVGGPALTSTQQVNPAAHAPPQPG
jgi:hypothetical protein